MTARSSTNVAEGRPAFVNFAPVQFPTDRAPSRPRSLMPYALALVQVLLALVFLFAGGIKLVLSADDLTKDIPLSATFLRFIGVCEVLGAIGLIVPGLVRFGRFLTPLAAAGLVVIMIGATVITVMENSVAEALFPLAVGLLSVNVVYGRRAWLTTALRQSTRSE